MQATTAVERTSRLRVFTALRRPGFRRFWTGMVASVMGFQIMMVAQGWLVFDLTGSELYLGYVGLAAGLPAIGLNLIGGVVADKVDQRRLLMVTQTLSSLVMLGLATLVLTELVEIWHVILTSFLIGSVQAFDGPSRQAFFPRLIEREDMMNAVALNSMVWQGTRVIGPAIGGIIIGTRLGASPGFYAAFVGFLLMAIMISTLRVAPVARSQGRSVFRDMAEGLAFVRSNRIFTFLIGMTFFNSMFGMSYIFMFPVFASETFDSPKTGLGFLSAATGVGAVLGTLFTASLGNFRRKGWLLLGRRRSLRSVPHSLRCHQRDFRLTASGAGPRIPGRREHVDIHDHRYEHASASGPERAAGTRDGDIRHDVEPAAAGRNAGGSHRRVHQRCVRSGSRRRGGHPVCGGHDYGQPAGAGAWCAAGGSELRNAWGGLLSVCTACTIADASSGHDESARLGRTLQWT